MKEGEWNITFLMDRNPPTKIVLLKRAEDKNFAAGWYTGVGGKHEPGETKQEAAERELKEETGLVIPIHEFARVIVDQKWYLYYFWGIFSGDDLPICDEGDLEWVDITEVLEKNIVRSTLHMIYEWSKRDFRTDMPWTLYTHKIEEISNGKEVVDKIIDGFHE